MNWALFCQSMRFQRLKLAVVSSALVLWGWILPVIYARFGVQFKALLTSGIIPEQFAKLGGGDIFSLPGSIALGFIHPVAISLTAVFSLGFSSTAIAGERQRGTLEVALSKPISRRTYYQTLLLVCLILVGIAVGALLLGSFAGATFAGVSDELPVQHLPLLWLNGVLLFGSFAAIGLAASASFDRSAPALGVTLGVVLIMYVFEIVGSLWPAAAILQPYSLFHYLQPAAVLKGEADPQSFLVLMVAMLIAIAWALVVFPKRDLAAPT